MPSRKGNLSGCGICVWLTAAFFLVLLVAGGALLSLYITLPENQVQPWFPAAGLIFVGTPWLFWITTCFYRSIATKTIGHEEKKVIRTAAAAAARGGGGDPATNSMNGGTNNDDSRGGEGAAVVVEATAGRVQQGRNHSNGVGDSSLNSNESEAPLALSMSS